MYKVEVNREFQFEIDLKSKQSVDWLRVGENSFHAIKEKKGYNLEVVSLDFEQKTAKIKVNGNKYEVSVEDRFDQLLKQLGMDNLASAQIRDLKAPMPGLVLEILVEAGKEVSKGDGLVILEAMKMENVIKSPVDGVIKKVSVSQGDTVEKNTLLITFEG